MSEMLVIFCNNICISTAGFSERIFASSLPHPQYCISTALGCYQKVIHPQPNEFQAKYYSTVAVKSTHDNITLPFNANLGELRTITPHDQYEFEQAANDTANQSGDS